MPLPPYTILSYELWQAAFGGRDMIGQTVEVNGLAREVIGIMPPGADVMDNRTEMWFPLGLNPGVRTNRGSHFLYLIGRLKEGVTPQQAQTELAALLGNWGERVGLKQGHPSGRWLPARIRRPTRRRPHPADGADAGGADRQAPAARSGCCRRPSGSSC